MFKDALHGSVLPYQKHVFLCFREPSSWPSQIETSTLPAYKLPHLLAASLHAHKDQLPKKTRFTLCRGSDDTEASKGDVLVFPDMIKYKDLVSSDIEDFVEDFLINEEDWSLGRTEKLHGFHIFVCAHGSRDMRCGVCGPALLERFEREISSQGLDSLVFVRSCSHIGGHKYAGNIIIYGKDSNGKIAGHWYGYVTPSDVAIILDEHISKGQIVHRLWRFVSSTFELQHLVSHINALGRFGPLIWPSYMSHFLFRRMTNCHALWECTAQRCFFEQVRWAIYGCP